MTKQDFLSLCLSAYGTSPDHPFEGDFETSVLRHADSGKWYALLMRLPRRKVTGVGDEVVDVVNLKMPAELFGSFGTADGVYPAYHMNKMHWISVILTDAPAAVVELLVAASFATTSKKRK